MLTLAPLAAVAALVPLADGVPEDDEVKAGWVALLIFVALAIAVAFLGWNLVKQLRKTRANADAGVFGPEDVERDDDAEGTSRRDDSTGPA